MKATPRTMRTLRALDDPGGDPRIAEPTQRSTAPGFCGLCVADVPAGAAMRPLGRDGALVAVCSDCDELHPRDGNYSFGSSKSDNALSTYSRDGNRRSGRKGKS